jgi:hypothetical protein
MTMQKYFFKIILILTIITLVSCARRGTITGGLKDTLAPVLNYSSPKNGSVNFNGKEIKLYFNEYVKLKNINKQLIVSPPMEKQPEVAPLNASKVITIKLKDTLLPNTTYSFNFGQSIEDNNEGNPYSQFKYLFSTGSFIDSLSLGVKIKDAFDLKTPSFVKVMLYEVNEKFNDSTIYKENPRYITNTLDSLKSVVLENLKPGKYLLVAIKDENNNNKFNPQLEKIGFQKEYITIPNDTIYELELFKEVLPFKMLKPVQVSGNRATIGYEGNFKGVKFDLKKQNEPVNYKISKLPKKDSLQIWFPKIKNDSIAISVSKDTYQKDFTLKLKDQKADTLSFKPENGRELKLSEKYGLVSSIPIVKIDASKITLINKDSVVVKFKTDYDEMEQKINFDFEKQPLEKYKMTVLPGAFTDFYEKVNDTLNLKFETKNTSDYGNLRIKLENVKQFPVIVQILNKKGDLVEERFSEKDTFVNFDLIEPNLFTLRLIYDTNKNGIWDPGSYMEKRQSEEVIYFPKEIDVRANWDVEQVFDIGN